MQIHKGSLAGDFAKSHTQSQLAGRNESSSWKMGFCLQIFLLKKFDLQKNMVLSFKICVLAGLVGLKQKHIFGRIP
jgi:hypothetical protein